MRVVSFTLLLLLVGAGLASRYATSFEAAWVNNWALAAVLKEPAEVEKPIVTLNNLVVEEDENIHLLTTLAQAYLVQGDDAQALAAWERALAVDPVPFIAFRAGQVYEEGGTLVQATAVWCQAQDTNLITYFEQQAQVETEPAQSDRLIELMRDLHRCQGEHLPPTNPLHWLHVGRAAELEDNVEAALAAYGRGLQLDPAHDTLFLAKYRLEMETYDYEAALATGLARLDVAFLDYRLPAQLANAYFYAEDYAQARSWYEQAVIRQPSYRGSFVYRMCQASNGLADYQTAVVDCESALSYYKGGEAAKVYEELAVAYEGLGDWEKAVEVWQQIIALQRHCRWQDYLQLGWLYEQMADQTAARRAYEAGLACNADANSLKEALDVLNQKRGE